MTETSYLWNGTTIGDANKAPYNKDSFGLFMFQYHDSLGQACYVIPGYLNDLEVKPAGGESYAVSVNTGAALIKGYFYELTEPITLLVDAPASYNRLDLVILRLTRSDQTVRLAILKGAESAGVMVEPTLTQNALIWEYPLARIYVGATLSYTYPYIARGYVQDKRQFLPLESDTGNNLLRNSEFMSRSGTAPDQWIFAGSSLNRYVGLSEPQNRGCLIYMQGTLLQNVRCSGHTVYTLHWFAYGNTLVDMLLIRIYGFRSDYSFIPSLDNEIYMPAQGLVNGVITTEFKQTVRFIEPPDIIQVQITQTNGSIRFGPLSLVPGYFPGPFEMVNHEIIPFQTPLGDAAWNATAKSTGSTLINLFASFAGGGGGNSALHDTKAVILRVRGRDSGSAAGNPVLSILGYAAPYNTTYGTLYLEGITNDTWREMVVYVPVNMPLTSALATAPQFRIDITATGAGTFDATIEVIGLVT